MFTSMNPEAPARPKFTPSMHWCIKKGSKRAQQFWIYCEQSQDNYLRLTFSIPSVTITRKSAFMMDEKGDLYLIEDVTAILYYRAVALFEPKLQIIRFPKSFLYPCDTRKLVVRLSLEIDEEEPRAPNQGNPNAVQCDVQDISSIYPEKLAPLLDYMYCIKFQGRIEGWFKIHARLTYDKYQITECFSDTFMFNNPRLKKLKEHKDYTTKELKFMKLYSDSKNKQQFLASYFNGSPEQQKLLENAPTLFPSKSKPSKTEQSGSNELLRATA
mmetsp:Transcript_10391/g.12802  ORF Transcript_10391/g.12802 Transcript_10391/m.12802 type:complete len:271 (-) Transcript_10391:43-855(-)